MITDIVHLLMERHDFFTALLWQHLRISVTAISAAMILGLIIGILASDFGKSSKWILGSINFIYTIPSISLLGFLIPLSGIGDRTAIFALTIYALLPMVRSTYTGFTHIDSKLLETAQGMGSTRLQLLYQIKFPLALPVIMAGIRNMATMTIALGGIASFIGAGGLGVAIYRGITTNNTAMTVAGSLLIALLALSVDGLLGIVEGLLRKRQAKKALVGVGVILLFFLISLLGSVKERDVIRIATKPMTEQLIIGELLQLVIEDQTDLRVKLNQGVGGGTSNILPAMKNKEFHLYPEYTGTGWNIILEKETLYREHLFEDMQTTFKEDLELEWVGMLGFENTYALAVRKDLAEQHNLRTFSDLTAISHDLVFGAEPDFFERADGYSSLTTHYGLTFKDQIDLDIGLKYQAISDHQIDVMIVFTTDGQLSVTDVVVLEDDLQIYPSYVAGNVVRMDILKQHPELRQTLLGLQGILTNETMARLNYEVEVLGQDPQVVAQNFLKDWEETP